MSKSRKDHRGGGVGSSVPAAEPHRQPRRRPFKIVHQLLCVNSINFQRRSLHGLVELTVSPLRSDLRKIRLNCKQCKLFGITVNDAYEANFTYSDLTLEVCQSDQRRRNLDYYYSSLASAIRTVDPDNASGELTIRLPPELQPVVAELCPFKITIEFAVEKPEGGVQFVVPDGDAGETMAERGAHVFTTSHENSARLCFPCVDSYGEPCTWRIELTVDAEMTAVSCGDLLETVYTSDLRRKTFHYALTTPTAAPNVAFAVGPFEILVDPHMHEVTHFCLPRLMPILKNTVQNLHQAFEFYEELLSCRYPYNCYKQVFVDQAYAESSSYATMTVFTTNILHPPRVIDQVPTSQKIMAQAIAEQFFGTFLCHHSWSDWWLPKGISRYLGGLFAALSFGNNEYRYSNYEDLNAVCDFEKNHGGIILDHSHLDEQDCRDLSGLPFPLKHPHLVSWQYFKVARIKASLIIRMIEQSIGRELLLQVFNKLLSLATAAAASACAAPAAAPPQRLQSDSWFNLLLSTDQFLKSISTVSGKDIKSIIANWVCSAGCTRFHCSFNFIRKRNILEVELKQLDNNAKGHRKYVGPLTLTVQELDGSFSHTLQVEEHSTKHEIQCHSKARKSKKKKIPLITGEEIDIDLVPLEQSDSPILWIRLDSAMTILREVVVDQPDFQWQYMLRYERDVVAQTEAIRALRRFPAPQTRFALTDTIEKEDVFYRVRMEACRCLALVANDMVSTWQGPPAMLQIFRKMFGSHSCPHIVRQNNFLNFQHYFLQCVMPKAMSGLRNIHNICPPEVLQFLLDLFKFNDNSKNPYSDNYYRACLVEALANTVTPAVTMHNVGALACVENLTPEVKAIVEEITRYLNLEKLLPSFGFNVTRACLRAIRRLQKFGHVPSSSALFKTYACYGNFTEVRSAAIEILCDYAAEDETGGDLNSLLEMAETDPEPYIRHKVLSHLTRNPPFSKRPSTSTDPLSSSSSLPSSSSFSILNTESLVHRLWRLLNTSTAHDPRVRSDVAGLYGALYGRLRPTVLPRLDLLPAAGQPDFPSAAAALDVAVSDDAPAAADAALASVRHKAGAGLEQIPTFLPVDFLQQESPEGRADDVRQRSGGGLLAIGSHPLDDREMEDPTEEENGDAAAAAAAVDSERLMMRQDVSAATLLSPGKGQQGIPLHIPVVEGETPMDSLSSGLGSGGGGGAASSSSGSVVPQSPFVEASDNSNSFQAPSVAGSLTGPVAFDSSMFPTASSSAAAADPHPSKDPLRHVKHKKKKSKTKHKHKHKHKHRHAGDRHEDVGGDADATRPSTGRVPTPEDGPNLSEHESSGDD